MSKDIVKDSIKCLANMEIRETTYQVARNVVLDEIERLNNIINGLEKYLFEERYNHQGEYVYTGKRKVEEVYTTILDKIKELKGE